MTERIVPHCTDTKTDSISRSTCSTSKKCTSRPGIYDCRAGTWNELRVYPEREETQATAAGGRPGRRRTKRARGLLPTYKLYALNEIYGWRFERDHCPSSLTSLPLYSSTWSSLSLRESPILPRFLRESLRSQRTAWEGRRDATTREQKGTRGR